MKTPHWLALALAMGIIGVITWQMVQQDPTGGFNQPPAQPRADDDLARLSSYAQVVCLPDEHHAGYTYTPHRYPRTCGGEITATIHHGFSTMRIPNSQDVQWMIAPPSEVMF